MAIDNQYDVIIIGAGPAGLMAATWLSRAGVKTLVVEKEQSRTQAGHADGLESRTIEILDSFGIGESVLAESNLTIEVSLWSHGNVKIEWGTVPTSIQIDDQGKEATDSPVEVRLKALYNTNDKNNGPETSIEPTFRTKYVVGCDGAKSWVRKHFGLRLEGESSDEHWGVVDCIPITDFPDIRKRCIIKSKVGNLMVIPRENHLVRLYIQLTPTMAAKFKRTYHPVALVIVAKAIMQPYTFDTTNIQWSTIYSIAHRLCPAYSIQNRVFLAGDAVHTHSPKAGQGMNVSMQDTYNLGWKLASVLKGMARPELLETYQDERLPVGDKLVSFDKRMCQGICSTAEADKALISRGGANPLKASLREENSSASGLSVVYPPGLLVTASEHRKTAIKIQSTQPLSKPYLAEGIVVGGRIPSYRVLSQSDSCPWHLQQRLRSTGQWNIIVFGGNITEKTQMERVERFAASLSQPESFFTRMNQNSRHTLVDSIAAHLVHSSSHRDVELLDPPEIFRPFDPENGYEYGQVFADDDAYGEVCGHAYQSYGIAAQGCMVLVRPDQHVAFVGDLEDTAALEAYFGRFLFC